MISKWVFIFCTIISTFAHVWKLHNKIFKCQTRICKLKLTRKIVHEKMYSHKIWESSRMRKKLLTDPRKLNPEAALSKREKQCDLLRPLSETCKLGDHHIYGMWRIGGLAEGLSEMQLDLKAPSSMMLSQRSATFTRPESPRFHWGLHPQAPEYGSLH